MTGDLTRDDLLAIIRRQDEQYKRLEADNKALRTDIARLKKRIEELEHKGRKYTAPHSREVRTADPKPPGRRAGQGLFTCKAPPAPDDVAQAIALSEPNTCPNCGFVGALIFKRTDKAWITELPAGLRAEVTEYHVPVMSCPQCGQPVRGEHPALTCRQWGATAHRLGGRLEAVVQTLRHEVGIAERRLPRVLALTTGVRLTQSAINQAARRLTRDGRALPAAVQRLEASLRAAPYVHHDDTGWRIDATQGWISTFRSADTVVFTANLRHTNVELRAVLGDAYVGVLVTDRFSVYDSAALDKVQQQKCLAHLIRNADEAAQHQQGRPGRGQRYAHNLATLLRFGIKLHRAYHDGALSRAEYQQQGESLTLHLERALNRTPLQSSANERLRQGVLKQHLRGRLLHFLHDPDIPPTNNAAERALRSVVITRKVSQCSKSARSAQTYTQIKSVVETARLRGHDPVQTLMDLHR